MATPDEPLRLRRSLLFVPGADPRKLERAGETGADTLLLDLEDSVSPHRKADARQRVAEALREGVFGGMEAAVRVNAPGTPHFAADLEAVVGAGGRIVMIPKAETPEGVAAVVASLQTIEQQRADAAKELVRLLLLVETPAGIANALALGRVTPRIDSLCFGHADFSLEMGLAEADASRGIVYHARCSLVLAAKACGVAPIDSVHLAVKDEAGFREDAALGLRLGFEGKLCIHPRQVAIANEVYTPGSDEIAEALRVLDAWERNQAEARGVFALDGKMIDAPLVHLKRRVIERARRAGVLP
jgi:citrate lyase subunit beta/citryl-CoA lyase